MMRIEEIKATVRQEVATVCFREVADTDALLDHNILDSVGSVDLAVALEGAFRISIPFVDINKQHFANVESIAAYVKLKLGA